MAPTSLEMHASLDKMSAEQLLKLPNGRLAKTWGIVTVKQQPSTANGTVFLSLEDETGSMQVIVWRILRDRERDALLRARLLTVYCIWQMQESGNLFAARLIDHTALLERVATSGRDFR